MTVLTYFFKHNTSDEHPFHLNTSAHTVVAQRQYQETIAQTKTSSNGLLRNNTLLGWGLSTSAWHLVAFPGHYVWLLCRDWPPKARGVTTSRLWSFKYIWHQGRVLEKSHGTFLMHILLRCSLVSDSLWHHGLWPTRLLCLGVFHIGILEWVAISYSRGSSLPRDQTCVSCISCIGRKILFYWAT